MAVRPGCAYLVDYVRRLIFDPSSDDCRFNDDDIQVSLDECRIDTAIVALDPLDEMTTDGHIIWRRWFSPYGFWDEDTTLQDSTGEILTPDDSDWAGGNWFWVNGLTKVVYVDGRTYDVYLVAADLLEQWAVSEPVGQIIQATADGQSFRRSAAASTQRLALANQYRKKATIYTLPMIRADWAPDRTRSVFE